jgi:hypothetical protein
MEPWGPDARGTVWAARANSRMASDMGGSFAAQALSSALESRDASMTSFPVAGDEFAGRIPTVMSL